MGTALYSFCRSFVQGLCFWDRFCNKNTFAYFVLTLIIVMELALYFLNYLLFDHLLLFGIDASLINVHMNEKILSNVTADFDPRNSIIYVGKN